MGFLSVFANRDTFPSKRDSKVTELSHYKKLWICSAGLVRSQGREQSALTWSKTKQPSPTTTGRTSTTRTATATGHVVQCLVLRRFLLSFYTYLLFLQLSDLHAQLVGKREAEKLFKIERTLVSWWRLQGFITV